jgi:hypothetical protein
VAAAYQEKGKKSVEDVVGRKVVEEERRLHSHAVDDPRREDAEPVVGLSINPEAGF